MNDLRGYRDSDLLAMLEQMEQMQAELTEKTQTIQALESELQQLPTLSEWQNVQVLMQGQTTQLQEQSLKIRRQAEHIAKQNESDRILCDNEKLKKENTELAAKTQQAVSDREKAESDAEYARTHMKIKTERLEVPALYKKCRNCNQKKLDKAAEHFRKTEKGLRGWLVIFEIISGIVVLFTSFRQKIFWTDCIAWIAGFGNILKSICEGLNRVYLSLAKWISTNVQNEAAHKIVFQCVAILLWTAMIAAIFFICRVLWNKYAEKIRCAVNAWVVSVWMFLLMIVVYLGDYIAAMIQLNLLSIWLIGSMLALGASVYIEGCKKYRY